MRSLLIVSIVLIIVAAALLGWAVYRSDTIIAWNKDRILAAAARRIGRNVDFDRAHIKLRGGIGLRITGFAVAEDPALGSGRFFNAAEVMVGLRLHPLRLRAAVTRVDVTGGVLHYRDGSRRLRLQDLKLSVDTDDDRANVRALSFRLGETEFAGSGAIESYTPLVVAGDVRSPLLRLADLQIQPADGVLEEARAAGRVTWSGGLAGGGTLTASRGKLMGIDYTDLAATIAVAEPWLVLESLRLEALDGALKAEGRVQLREAPFPFEAALHVRGMDIGAWLKGATGFPPVKGTLEGHLKVAGEGRTWDAIKLTLAGTGNARVLGGRVLEFNLAEQALEGMTGIHGLGWIFSRALKNRYPHIFERGTTVLEQLDGEFKAEGGKVMIERATLKAKDYGVAGQGSVDLDGVTEVNGVLTLSPELSADLRLNNVTNDRGEAELRFAVVGTVPNVRVQPERGLVGRLLPGGAGTLGSLLGLVPGAKAKPN